MQSVLASSFRSLLIAAAGWLLVAPIAALVPKRRDWIAVLGRDDGKFLDNAKYFFLQMPSVSPGTRTVFVTERRQVAERVGSENFEAILYPSIRSAFYLARCGTAVVDDSGWFRSFRKFFLIRARVIQLWHGAGFKRIEIMKWRGETGPLSWVSRRGPYFARTIYYRLTGRWPHFSAVVCTSNLYRDEVYAPSFRASAFPIAGYPRNDFGQALTDSARVLAWSNVDPDVSSRLSDWRQTDAKVVLVAPTFRDSGTVPMQISGEAAKAIDSFAQLHNTKFVFKFHPADQSADHVEGEHFHVCARNSDVYPLLPYLSALITDYSTIALDFLWINKPLVFLIPEHDNYELNDRKLRCNPRPMMPGPVVHGWADALDALLTTWALDMHVAERAKLRALVFDDLPQGHAATATLLAMMQTKGWVAPTKDAAAASCPSHHRPVDTTSSK